MVIKPQPVVINLSYAREVGDSLKTLRESRQLSRDEVSDILVCSVQQVLGLESGSAKCFYGSRLFAQALSRYAELLSFPLDRTQLVQSGEWIPGAMGAITEQSLDAKTVSAEILGKQSSETTSKSLVIASLLFRKAITSVKDGVIIIRQYLLGISMALAIGAISIFAINLLWDTQYPASASGIAVPAQNDAQSTSVERKKLTVSPEAETVAQRKQLHLNFTGPSWVQLRSINQKSIDRLYQKGESLSFDIDQVTSLVVGNVDVTQFEMGGKRVDGVML